LVYGSVEKHSKRRINAKEKPRLASAFELFELRKREQSEIAVGLGKSHVLDESNATNTGGWRFGLVAAGERKQLQER
jgi:hypothetical protein